MVVRFKPSILIFKDDFQRTSESSQLSNLASIQKDINLSEANYVIFKNNNATGSFYLTISITENFYVTFSPGFDYDSWLAAYFFAGAHNKLNFFPPFQIILHFFCGCTCTRQAQFFPCFPNHITTLFFGGCTSK